MWLPTVYVVAISVPLAVIDFREHRLPNKWVMPGYIFAIIAVVGQGVATGIFPILPIASGAGYFLFLFVLAWFGGMGMGDVKLAGVLGVAAGLIGVPAAVLSPMFAFMAAGLFSAVTMGVMAVGNRAAPVQWRSVRIPFGPSMLIGLVLAICSNVLTFMIS